MRLYKVLIVDDDTLARIALKTMIEWNEHGFDLIGEAGNGKEALKLIHEGNPDIVLLDIQMPVMDGLELLQILRNMNNAPKVVVLSTHDELELVKKAIKLGAYDYLVKLNLDFKHLIEVMEHIAYKLDNPSGDEEIEPVENKQFVKNIGVLRSIFFRQLLEDFYISKEELIEKMHILDITFPYEKCTCFVITADEFASSNTFDKKSRAIKRFSAINIIEEILGGYCFEFESGEFVAFSSFSDSSSVDYTEDFVSEEAKTYGKRVEAMLHEYLNLSVHIVMGTGENTADGLKRAYERAVDTMNADTEADANIMVTEAVKYIKEHFTEKITLSDVAASVNLNPTYLSNLMKKELNKSYQDIITDFRIEKAKTLIKNNDYKIYEVGELVGYTNSFYFTRIFKKKTGHTPTEYKMM